MKKILMCSPEYFGVSYEINPWMANNIGQVDHGKAVTQWNNLYLALKNVCDVVVMPGVQDLPDLVFTANAGIIKNHIAVVSLFYKQQRQPEEIHFENWFKQHGFSVSKLKNSYEGEGDHLLDKWGRHWMGTGFRSSAAAASELSTILNAYINTLELVDPRWYHLDTCFTPLPKGELLYYPAAFSEKSQRLIANSFTRRIEISEEDALCFSCNAVCVDNEIFLPKNKHVSDALRAYGYIVHDFDLSEFMKAGGAAKCLVLYIENTAC